MSQDHKHSTAGQPRSSSPAFPQSINTNVSLSCPQLPQLSSFFSDDSFTKLVGDFAIPPSPARSTASNTSTPPEGSTAGSPDPSQTQANLLRIQTAPSRLGTHVGGMTDVRVAPPLDPSQGGSSSRTFSHSDLDVNSRTGTPSRDSSTTPPLTPARRSKPQPTAARRRGSELRSRTSASPGDDKKEDSSNASLASYIDRDSPTPSPTARRRNSSPADNRGLARSVATRSISITDELPIEHPFLNRGDLSKITEESPQITSRNISRSSSAITGSSQSAPPFAVFTGLPQHPEGAGGTEEEAKESAAGNQALYSMPKDSSGADFSSEFSDLIGASGVVSSLSTSDPDMRGFYVRTTPPPQTPRMRGGAFPPDTKRTTPSPSAREFKSRHRPIESSVLTISIPSYSQTRFPRSSVSSSATSYGAVGNFDNTATTPLLSPIPRAYQSEQGFLPTTPGVQERKRRYTPPEQKNGAHLVASHIDHSVVGHGATIPLPSPVPHAYQSEQGFPPPPSELQEEKKRHTPPANPNNRTRLVVSHSSIAFPENIPSMLTINVAPGSIELAVHPVAPLSSQPARVIAEATETKSSACCTPGILSETHTWFLISAYLAISRNFAGGDLLLREGLRYAVGAINKDWLESLWSIVPIMGLTIFWGGVAVQGPLSQTQGKLEKSVTLLKDLYRSGTLGTAVKPFLLAIPAALSLVEMGNDSVEIVFTEDWHINNPYLEVSLWLFSIGTFFGNLPLYTYEQLKRDLSAGFSDTDLRDHKCWVRFWQTITILGAFLAVTPNIISGATFVEQYIWDNVVAKWAFGLVASYAFTMMNASSISTIRKHRQEEAEAKARAEAGAGAEPLPASTVSLDNADYRKIAFLTLAASSPTIFFSTRTNFRGDYTQPLNAFLAACGVWGAIFNLTTKAESLLTKEKGEKAKAQEAKNGSTPRSTTATPEVTNASFWRCWRSRPAGGAHVPLQADPPPAQPAGPSFYNRVSTGLSNLRARFSWGSSSSAAPPNPAAPPDLENGNGAAPPPNDNAPGQ